MNSQYKCHSSFHFLLKSLWANRLLIKNMAWRQIVGKYKGSFLGLLWTFVRPLSMLLIYTFVFGVVFKARFGTEAGAQTRDFAVILFSGLIMANMLIELFNQAPSLILSNKNFVTKVIFPLEILPVISLLTALFHALASFCVLLIAIVLLTAHLQWTIVLFPLVLIPFSLLVLGGVYVLSSIGVFVRDLPQLMGIVTMLLMFTSAIFYPIQRVPHKFRIFIEMNPLTFIVEQARRTLIYGLTPEWGWLALYALIAFVICWLGFALFQQTRRGFADVI